MCGTKISWSALNLLELIINFCGKNFVIVADCTHENATPIKLSAKKFCGQGVNHKIHENIIPRISGAIWYAMKGEG